TPSKATDPGLTAIASNVQTAKRRYPGKSAELVRTTTLLPGTHDERTDLEDWRCMLESAGRELARAPSSQELYSRQVGGRGNFTQREPLLSPRDLVLIETTLRNENTVLHIATSLPQSKDLPKYLRPTSPYVRARLDLGAYCVQIIPNETPLDDAVSIPLSTSSSQQGHSLRVAFYYQFDLKSWTVNSSISLTTHVPQCIAAVHTYLLRHGRPPHLARHGNRIQIENDEYDADNGLYDLRYSVLEGRDEDEDDTAGSARRDVPTARSSGYDSATSGIRQREVSTDDTVTGTTTVLSSSPPSSSSLFTTAALLGNESPPIPTPPPSTKGHHDDAFRQTSVDVEIDGERWAAGVDVRITVLVNDRASEAYTRECVDCFRYMNTQRFIVRLRHPSTVAAPSSVPMLSTKSGGREEELVGVRLKIDRVPRAAAATAEVAATAATVTAGEVEEADGVRKSTLIVNGQPRQTEEYPMFEDPEQEFMGDEYAEEVNEVDEEIREQEARENEEKRRQREGIKMNGSGKRKEDAGSNDSESIKSDKTTSTSSNVALPLSSKPVPTLDLITPNPSDPDPVKAAHAQFLSLLREPASSWKLVQQTGPLTLSRMEMPDHVMGVLKGEGVYEGCNVWDIKAVVEAFGARRSWDNMFDDGVVLEQFTPWCSLVYTKLKGFWPTSPRDAVSFNTTYFTTNTVQIFTTSTDDASLSQSFPDAETAGYVRAQVDIAGWHAESPVPTSVHIIYVIQSDPKGWIPAYVLTTMATQAPAVLGTMVEFIEKSGAPPNLIELYNGRMNGVLYDHERGSWRLEYVPCSDGSFARNPPDVVAAAAAGAAAEIEKTDNTDIVPAEAKGKGKALPRDNGNLNDGSLKNNRDSSSVLSSTPSSVLTAEIRLDARKWSSSGDYEVVVDPPPSRVTVTKGRAIDPFGLWMQITHEQEGAPPLGGRVLVMVRKSALSGWGVSVNGIQTPVTEEKGIPTSAIAAKPLIKVDEEVKKTKKASLDVAKPKPKAKESARVKVKNGDKIELGENGSLLLPKIPTDAKKASAKPAAPKVPPVKSAKEEPVITPNTPIDAILAKLGNSPVQQVLSALALLRRLDDQQHGWAPVSDKGGLSISKRVVPPEIPEYFAVVKAVKVIERFSLEEVAAVVTNSGCRKAWDDMLDEREVLKYLGNGCAVVKSGLKAWFPLKSRDLFTASCTARASANASTNSQPSRVFFVETSISDYPHQVPLTDPTAKPRGRLYLYGWMLEAVDPYTTNHQIPSTRVTFMASLDMGGTIPGTVSSLVTIGMPKAIQQVETYLKSKGAPPYLTLPPQLIELRDSDLAEEGDGVIPAQRFEDVYYELPKASSHTGYRDVVNSEFNHDSREFKVGLKFDLESLSPSVSTNASSGHVGVAAANELLFTSGEVRDAQEIRVLSPSISTSSRAKPASSLFMERGGSAPGRFLTNELPNGDKKNVKSKGSVDSEDDDLDEKVVLEIIVDLKRYPQGYEILTEVSPLEVNGSIGAVSSLSSASSSSLPSKQPFLLPQAVSVKIVDIPPAKSHTSSLSPSSSKFKHSIHVSVHPSVLRRLIRHRHINLPQSDPESDTRANVDQSIKSAHDNDGSKLTEQENERFMLDFLLLPLNKLTKKGVLGEGVDKWNGVVVVNGGEIEAAKGLSEKDLAAQTQKDISTEGQGGVVAKAKRRNTLESESSPSPKSKSPRTPVTSYPGLSWLTGGRTDLDREKVPNNANGDQGADQGYDLDMESVREPAPFPQNEVGEDWAQTTRKLTLGSQQTAEPRSSLVPSHSTNQRDSIKFTTPTGQVQTWLGTLQDQRAEGQYPFAYLLVMGILCLLLGMVLRAWLITPYCGVGYSTSALPARFALGDSRGYQQGSFRETMSIKGLWGWDYVLVAAAEGQYPFAYLLVMGILCLLLGMVLRACIAPYCKVGYSTSALPAGFALGDSRGYQQGSFREMMMIKGLWGWDYVLVAAKRKGGE
ncbi:hypothetical protein BC937DRAFT_87130, partial [Endogone sp. FLAS-F59071]